MAFQVDWMGDGSYATVPVPQKETIIQLNRIFFLLIKVTGHVSHASHLIVACRSFCASYLSEPHHPQTGSRVTQEEHVRHSIVKEHFKFKF